MNQRGKGRARRGPAAPTAVALTVLGLLLPACGDSGECLGPLEVGFGRSTLVWRAGAKPGQVGTSTTAEGETYILEMFAEALPTVVGEPDPATKLNWLTDWVLTRLEDRVGEPPAAADPIRNAQPGVYNFLAEPSVGIETPPHVSAAVVRRGSRKVALVRGDLYIMHDQIHRRVASLIEGDTGIGREQLFIAGTHNHSTAHTASPSPGVWMFADAFDPRHFAYVTHQIADAIREANANLEPAELRVTRQTLDNVQHNIIGPARATVTPPGGTTAEEVDAGYPYDHFDSDLLMLRFDSPEGRPLGSVFVFGMHPESLEGGHGLLSGEWPTRVEDAFLAETGVPTMWLPGPLGDVEPDRGRNDPDHEFFRGGFEAMATMASIITAKVLDAWDEAGEQPGTDEPEFAQISRSVHGPEDTPIPNLAELGPRLDSARLVQDSTAMQLHLVRLGDALLVGVPAEVTTDMALNIKSRLDRDEGNVFQGYVWPDNPNWVRAEIERNFSTTELDSSDGVPLPMIVSVTNGYFGYVVTRWEYLNRSHYREGMTFFGETTADHIATSVVSMAREMAGGPRAEFFMPEWSDLDEEGTQQIQDFLVTLEAEVAELSRQVPVGDPAEVGTVLEAPTETVPATEPVRLSWIGGTNDLDPPHVHLEREVSDGVWEPIAHGPSGEVYILFEAPDRWTAQWNQPEASEARVRLWVSGAYRGAEPGVTEPDPLWDPDGANVAYTVESEPFTVTP
jgi:hypothetical protein